MAADPSAALVDFRFALPMLPARQIDLIADWLRAEWYRPAVAGH